MKREPDECRNSTSWDQATIDRLVDGELSATEYEELMQSFERNPQGWRACSLAFLEAQAWRTAIREATRDGESAIPPAMPSAMPSERLRQASTNERHRRTWSPVAVAASIALAFLAGRATLGPSSTGNNPLLVQSANYPTLLRPRDGSVSLANHGLLDGQLAIQPHTLDSLQKLGVQVSQDVGYFSGRTEDGKPVIWPVQNVKLTPTNHPPY